ncbi:hypothetical protein BHM03_00054731 [Ensete ventricosum]|nr:hypothetical protein BHM03_00054731 [Ensete ventricosum]
MLRRCEDSIGSSSTSPTQDSEDRSSNCMVYIGCTGCWWWDSSGTHAACSDLTERFMSATRWAAPTANGTSRNSLPGGLFFSSTALISTSMNSQVTVTRGEMAPAATALSLSALPAATNSGGLETSAKPSLLLLLLLLPLAFPLLHLLSEQIGLSRVG